MLSGGKKFLKPEKTKFRKHQENELKNVKQQKHYDKTLYRLMKQEKDHV